MIRRQFTRIKRQHRRQLKRMHTSLRRRSTTFFFSNHLIIFNTKPTHTTNRNRTRKTLWSSTPTTNTHRILFRRGSLRFNFDTNQHFNRFKRHQLIRKRTPNHMRRRQRTCQRTPTKFIPRHTKNFRFTFTIPTNLQTPRQHIFNHNRFHNPISIRKTKILRSNNQPPHTTHRQNTRLRTRRQMPPRHRTSRRRRTRKNNQANQSHQNNTKPPKDLHNNHRPTPRPPAMTTTTPLAFLALLAFLAFLAFFLDSTHLP